MNVAAIRRCIVVSSAALLAFALGALPTKSGPLVIGGDDLPEHGCYDGAANLYGWAYMERVLTDMFSPGRITRPNDGSIAALGSSSSTATVCPGPGNAGAAIYYTGSVALGRSVAYYDGAAAIEGFFAALSAGSVNPAVIWIAGTGSANDQDPSEVNTLACNHAEDLRAFINSGGGVLSHGFGNYDWASGMLSGMVEVFSCEATGATLTPFGQALYPSLSNSNIDISAGPCHAHFEGTLAPLQVIANDGVGNPYIIGGNVTFPLPTSLRVTNAGICCNYRLSLLAGGLENTNGIGPLAVQPVSNGYIVSMYESGQLLKYTGRADAQPRASAVTLATHGQANAAGLASVGSARYMAQQGVGQVVQYSEANGSIVRVVASIARATGIASFPPIADPQAGHVFASQAGNAEDDIYEIDPGPPTTSGFTTFGADGVCITVDGTRILTAAGAVVNVHDASTGALLSTSPPVCNNTDGIALGEGILTGKAFINCTNGEVWEWKYDPGPADNCPAEAGAGPLRLIMNGGTRGDFIAVDRYVPALPGGSYPSLLLTQSDQIVRMGLTPTVTTPFAGLGPTGDPHPSAGEGGWFGPPDSDPSLLLGPLILRFDTKTDLRWDPSRKVDLVRGDLNLLKSTGSFAGNHICLMDDYVSPHRIDTTVPAPGSRLYYVARDLHPQAPIVGYTSGSPRENPGQRNSQIQACP